MARPSPARARRRRLKAALRRHAMTVALERLTGLSPALLQKIADGRRDVSDGISRNFAEGLLKEADRLRKAAGKTDDVAGRRTGGSVSAGDVLQ
jgi:hypothetical protein